MLNENASIKWSYCMWYCSSALFLLQGKQNKLTMFWFLQAFRQLKSFVCVILCQVDTEQKGIKKGAVGHTIRRMHCWDLPTLRQTNVLWKSNEIAGMCCYMDKISHVIVWTPTVKFIWENLCEIWWRFVWFRTRPVPPIILARGENEMNHWMDQSLVLFCQAALV